MNDDNTVQPVDDELNDSGSSDAEMPDSIMDTTVVPGGSRRLREKTGELEQVDADATQPEGDAYRVTLVVRGMRYEILLRDGETVVLGRFDERSATHPDIDLTPFGGATRGVSREHVRLSVREQQLYLTDLGSTNGSFFRGEVLTASEPRLLHSGDEVILGRLAIRFILDDAGEGGTVT